MNPVLGIIGNMLGGTGNNIVGNAQANSTGSGLNNILGLFNMLKGDANPMQTLQSMAQTNPQIKEAMDYIQNNGGDAQSAFYKLAEQRGIDPNNILNMIK